MKIPESFFVIINPMMKFLLNSPLHALMSNSVLVLYFKGATSGKQFSTPLRYHKDRELLRCFSSGETKWWRNFRDPVEAQIQLRGSRLSFEGKLLTDNPIEIKQLLVSYLTEHPADAAYHNVRRTNGLLDNSDLDVAAVNCKIVEFRAI